MTEQQLANRSTFIRKLIAAGWDPRGWEQLFDGGARLKPEAQAEYNNGILNLRMSYYAGEGYIQLECVQREVITVVAARFYPKEDNLVSIIDIVIAEQDTLSLDNFSDIIKRIIPYCSHIFLESGLGLTKVS